MRNYAQFDLLVESLEAVSDTVVVTTSNEQSFATHVVGILNRQRGDVADVRSKTANLFRPKKCVNISTLNLRTGNYSIGTKITR